MKMFSFGGLLAVMVIAVGFGLFEAQTAKGVVKLQAELAGTTANGNAMYVEYAPNTRAFFANLEDAVPNADLTITFRRGSTLQKITTLQADEKGRARVTLYSSIPQLKPDDMLEVWQAKSMVPIASGHLRQVVIEDK